MGTIDPDSYEDMDWGTQRARQKKREAKVRRARLLARDDEAALEEITKHGAPEAAEAEQAFIPTFSGSHWERWWIYHYLGPFHHDKVIADVLAKVKGGKEATVYCCAAHPATGLDLIAAKVYRPRIFRNLRNDALYRQGRPLLDPLGRTVRDRRHLRAVARGTRVGHDVEHTSWLAHEYQTIKLLHEAGADVPRPLAQGENTILMEYIGALGQPAPTLNHVTLQRGEAGSLFRRLLHNVELMLANGRIHADLSAYNVLYWRGKATIIDFPQAIDPRSHPDAFPILQRDVERLCQHFARYGIASEPWQLAQELWARAVGAIAEPPLAALAAEA